MVRISIFAGQFDESLKSPRRILLIGIAILILLAFFGSNNIIELRGAEPRRAIISMEMVLSSNYLIPQIHDSSYYNKPPLFNWWMALFFKVLGSFDEWAVRIPSLVAFLLTAILNFVLVRRFVSTQAALLSSLFLITTADILFYGSMNAGEIDLFFSLLVYAQVMAIFYLSEQKKFLWMFLVSYFLAALGTLTKGPPSIAFQGLTLLPWLIMIGHWRQLLNWKHITGIMVYLAVVGGYFYKYSYHDDAVGFMVRLFKEASQRTGLEHDVLSTLFQSALFPAYLASLLMPWSLALIFFFRKDFKATLKGNPILKFCVVFILFNIPLYWFSGDHKARYLYPFFPFLCVLFSYYFIHAQEHLKAWRKHAETLFSIVMIIGIVIFAAPPFVLYTAEIPNILLKSFTLVTVGLALVFGYRRFKEYRIFLFIAFILLVRIGFNFVYLPLVLKYDDKMIYREHVNKVLEITAGEQVHWTGNPHVFTSDATIGPFTFQEVTLTTAPLIIYQVPYYLVKRNGHVMGYDKIRQPNKFYLAHRGAVPQLKEEILYSFPDKWVSQELILFKTR